MSGNARAARSQVYASMPGGTSVNPTTSTPIKRFDPAEVLSEHGDGSSATCVQQNLGLRRDQRIYVPLEDW